MHQGPIRQMIVLLPAQCSPLKELRALGTYGAFEFEKLVALQQRLDQTGDTSYRKRKERSHETISNDFLESLSSRQSLKGGR